MSRGLSKQQKAVMAVVERHGAATPHGIWAYLDLDAKGEFNPSFSNLCRSLRSLRRRGLLEVQGVVYHNPSGRGIRYLTREQLTKYREALKEKYGP